MALCLCLLIPLACAYRLGDYDSGYDPVPPPPTTFQSDFDPSNQDQSLEALQTESFPSFRQTPRLQEPYDDGQFMMYRGNPEASPRVSLTSSHSDSPHIPRVSHIPAVRHKPQPIPIPEPEEESESESPVVSLKPHVVHVPNVAVHAAVHAAPVVPVAPVAPVVMPAAVPVAPVMPAAPASLVVPAVPAAVATAAPIAVPVIPPIPLHREIFPQSVAIELQPQPSFVSNGERVERDQKIIQALDAVKSELVSKGQELTREREWANSVENMVKQYQSKLRNVHEHITKLHDEMKGLLVKKKQIENVEIQQQLKEKLSLAEVDMNTLNDALDHVRSQTEKFGNKRKELERQIKTLEGQMAKLKGEPPRSHKSKRGRGGGGSLLELDTTVQDDLEQERETVHDYRDTNNEEQVHEGEGEREVREEAEGGGRAKHHEIELSIQDIDNSPSDQSESESGKIEQSDSEQTEREIEDEDEKKRRKKRKKHFE